jgi:hypothetical protein
MKPLKWNCHQEIDRHHAVFADDNKRHDKINGEEKG